MKTSNYVGPRFVSCSIKEQHLLVNNEEIVDVTISNGTYHLREKQFYNFVNIESVTLPDSIKRIESSAFRGCKSLKVTTYLGSISNWCKIEFEDVDANPISYSHNLIIDREEIKDVNIENSITKINNYAFYNCCHIVSLAIPISVTSIGKEAFFGCVKLRELSIPGSVTKIGSSAFAKCTSLTFVYIPYSLTEIEQCVFQDCSSLDNINIPESVTKIGYRGFAGCSSLKSLTIPNSVLVIEKYAFENCHSLININIPSQIKIIEDSAFAGCTMLNNICIPNGVTTIMNSAFKDCTNLAEVILPPTITLIATNAFENCTSLKKIIVPAGQKVRFVQIGLGVYEHLIQEEKEDETVALLKLAEAHAFAKDYTQSVLYYTQAADKGSTAAAYQLAEWYANGENLAKDNEKALQYYQMAAKTAYKDAVQKVKQIQDIIDEEKKRYDEQMLEFLNEQNTYYLQQANQARVNSIPEQPKIKYIFFDSESNGLPREPRLGVSFTSNWPRMIQLAWIVTDENGNVLKRQSHIIYPQGFNIIEPIEKLTRITTERAQCEGVDLYSVLTEFMEDVNDAKLLIAHNIDFDKRVVGCELYRENMDYDSLLNKSMVCTMQKSTNFCAIPSNSNHPGYKWPKLEELHMKLFGTTFSGAHDALADVEATKKCFFELKNRGIIS